ncbi:hypothetical protein WME98_20740 [Sorangium sp. So ce296]|uniref:hypothetical protein n=1 Tax=Sorangium sp. So ce296 TaxID=3133296 RepID=UPI003F5E308F
MKRLTLLGLASVLAPLLAGCPIYDDADSHFCDAEDCGPGIPSSDGCDEPADCGINETCGEDNECHVGDCTAWGCSDGFECVVDDDHTASCVATGSTGQGGGGGGGGGGSDAVYCGNPDDCAEGETCAPDGTCQPGSCDQVLPSGEPLGCVHGYVCEGAGDDATCVPATPAACGADADCASLGADYLCVSGICTAPQDQCFDQTQCPVNDKCVEGKCTPACSEDADCPSSYRCDTTLGICSQPAQPCVITDDCGGPSAVCVDGACVPRSDGEDCPEGDVWVENGCIPNQSSNFVCGEDGAQDVCAPGSICLHHSCYISCGPSNPNACANQSPSLSECRTVTTFSGVHQVCGSSDNLGGECDPETSCADGGICVDGFCR